MFAALQTCRFAAQQTCDQRSGIASGSKLERRALTLYFPVISYYKLLYVPLIEIWRRVGSRSVRDFRTCKKNAAAHW